MNTMSSYDEKYDPTLKNMCMAVKLFGEAAYKRSTVRRKRAADDKSAGLDQTNGRYASKNVEMTKKSQESV
ncbi:hypothetical protein QR680_004001 [Steinernema hermaphroditum]|uniref:Uncharacterized protein n=1 Tax=Steinernema hermaphroditum TaxID=289476 RepID=A0AA39HPJ2_9BILA|nr:hypothetical protein QR680_004001 [Steinernema hermaphroditum]